MLELVPPARPAPRARRACDPVWPCHKTAYSTVHPGNGHEIVRQVLQHAPTITFQVEDRGHIGGRGYSRNVTTDPAGLALAEHWEVADLGHAWSGDSFNGSYTDPVGPDASAEMIRFFLD